MFKDYIPNGVGASLGQVCIPLEKHTAMFPAVDSADVQALAACVDHGVDRFA